MRVPVLHGRALGSRVVDPLDSSFADFDLLVVHALLQTIPDTQHAANRAPRKRYHRIHECADNNRDKSSDNNNRQKRKGEGKIFVRPYICTLGSGASCKVM